MIYYKTKFDDDVIVENGVDTYVECEFLLCEIIHASELKDFCKDCNFMLSNKYRISEKNLDIYNNIKTENDAILHIKNSEKLIRQKCKEILKYGKHSKPKFGNF